jgi:hypothetical protein
VTKLGEGFGDLAVDALRFLNQLLKFARLPSRISASGRGAFGDTGWGVSHDGEISNLSRGELTRVSDLGDWAINERAYPEEAPIKECPRRPSDSNSSCLEHFERSDRGVDQVPQFI